MRGTKRVVQYDGLDKAVSAAQNASWKFWVVVCSMLFVGAAAVMITQSVFLYDSQSSQDRQIAELGVNLISNVSDLRQDDMFIRLNLTQVNMSNMMKIGDLSLETFGNFTIVQNELDIINTLLNISVGNAMTFGDMVSMNFSTVNATLIAIEQDISDLQAKDMVLMNTDSELITNLTNLEFNLLSNLSTTQMQLQQNIERRIASINGVNGTLPEGAFTLNPLEGINITMSSMQYALDIKNTGIVTVNMMGAGPTGDLTISGTGGITINSGPAANEVQVDGSSLTTAINNIMNVNSIQDIDIMNLTTLINNQQMQINVLEQTLVIVGDMLNGTSIDVNMTLTELIMDVVMLKQQVTTLENQVANLTAIATPTGSIVPWGGTTVNVPSEYLLCDGRMVSKTTYNDLFTVIDCKFCTGMNCTTTDFCLPDLRGNIPVGIKSTGGTFKEPLGTPVGTETHTLSVTEMPSHSHTMQSAGAHGHPIILANGVGNLDNGMGGTMTTTSWGGSRDNGIAAAATGTSNPRVFRFTSWDGDPFGNAPNGDSIFFSYYAPNSQARLPLGAGATEGGAHTHPINANGGGNAHNIVQPSVVIAGYMIKI